jgi:hypothetical protein
MHILLIILMLVVVVLLSSVLVCWIVINTQNYTNVRLKPNKNYSIGGRDYKFPNIPIRGEAYKLQDKFVTSLRDLFKRTILVLEDVGLGEKWWCTGGTLLGTVRHGAIPMPFDDDVDVAVMYEHKNLLFSKEFGIAAKRHGLQSVRLVTNTAYSADKGGSAMRLQYLNGGDNFAAIDIFMCVQTEDGKVVKLDGWTGNRVVESSVERFALEDVFPLVKQDVDGIGVNLPQNPLALLHQQYGKNVLDMAIARPLLFSHRFAFEVLRLLWVRV